MDKVMDRLVRIKEWFVSLSVVRRLGVIAIAVAIASAIANIWVSMSNDAEYLRDSNANEQAIAQLMSELDAERASTTPEVDEVGGYLEDANRVGEAVGKIQTNLVGNLEDDALTPLAEFVSQDDNVWLGRWLLGIQETYSWRFCQSYDYDGDIIPMLWQAVTPDGTIIAYARAEFNIEDGLVHDIELDTTSAGKALISYQDEPAADAANEEGSADEA